METVPYPESLPYSTLFSVVLFRRRLDIILKSVCALGATKRRTIELLLNEYIHAAFGIIELFIELDRMPAT